MAINSKIIAFDKGETGATGIPYDLAKVTVENDDVSVDKMVLYPSMPWGVSVRFGYINNSLDPIDNWITPINLFTRFWTPSIISVENLDWISEYTEATLTENWETETLAKIKLNFPTPPAPSLPIFFKKFDATYTYQKQWIDSKRHWGVSYCPELPDTSLVKYSGQLPANSATLRGLITDAVEKLWPSKSTDLLSRILLIVSMYGEARADTEKCGRIFKIIPPDPQHSTISMDYHLKDYSDPSSLSGGFLKIGNSYNNVDLTMPFDPVDWPSNISSTTTDFVNSNQETKNYVYVFADLDSWEPWSPTAHEWIDSSPFTATQDKQVRVDGNLYSSHVNPRNVTLEYFLTMKLNKETKMLCWFLYIIEYEQGTSNVVKGWLATKYSKLSKWISPGGDYTVRHMYDSKTGKSEDITNNSNLKITVANNTYSPISYIFPVYP